MPTPGRRMSRRLVITADDLGRDEATDATITSLAADGLITATSLIVLSPHAAAALGPIRDLGLDPGLHATLSSEQGIAPRSEEHTSELQSRGHLVCRLLHEKQKS